MDSNPEPFRLLINTLPTSLITLMYLGLDSHYINCIIPTQRSLTVGAAQEQTPERRTDTTSAPTSQREAKDPTQSAHYRLWGPGFLDMSLVPEEQEPATPTGAPAQARATKIMTPRRLATWRRRQEEAVRGRKKLASGLLSTSHALGVRSTQKPDP